MSKGVPVSIGLSAVDVTDKAKDGSRVSGEYAAGINRSASAREAAIAKQDSTVQSKTTTNSSRRAASCPPPEHAH